MSEEDLTNAVNRVKEDFEEKQRIAKLKQKLRDAKKENSAPPATSNHSSGSASASGGLPGDAEACGGGVYVRSGTTSCSFGLNVAADYYTSPSNTFVSFSPETGKSYSMSCSGSAVVTCTGGNNAAVYLP